MQITIFINLTSKLNGVVMKYIISVLIVLSVLTGCLTDSDTEKTSNIRYEKDTYTLVEKTDSTFSMEDKEYFCANDGSLDSTTYDPSIRLYTITNDTLIVSLENECTSYVYVGSGTTLSGTWKHIGYKEGDGFENHNYCAEELEDRKAWLASTSKKESLEFTSTTISYIEEEPLNTCGVSGNLNSDINFTTQTCNSGTVIEGDITLTVNTSVTSTTFTQTETYSGPQGECTFTKTFPRNYTADYCQAEFEFKKCKTDKGYNINIYL